MIAPAIASPRAPRRDRRPDSQPTRVRKPLSSTPAILAFTRACQSYGPKESIAAARGHTARALYHATATLCTLSPEERRGFLELVQQQIDDLQDYTPEPSRPEARGWNRRRR